MKFKCGFISVVGRPNVGKSTLINTLIGEKISIVSSIPQTTRYIVKGILTKKKYQMIFIDTPGLHLFHHRLAAELNYMAKSSLGVGDLILYVVDVTRFPIKEEESILKLIVKSQINTVVALNKVDKSSDYINNYIDLCKKYDSQLKIFKYFIPISALEGTNLDKLEGVLTELIPEGEAFYSKEENTDFYMEFRISDIIREKFFLFLKKELPHSLAVKTIEITDKGKIVYVKSVILVERESQRKIVLGNKGEVIKEVGVKSRQDIEKIFSKKVYIDLQVKVLKDWQRNPRILAELGYKEI